MKFKMNKKDKIAFFWIGTKIEIPEIFVKSIRMVYGDDAEIYQLTNTNTLSVEGVTQVFRYALPDNLMLARLKAYNNFIYKKGTIFYDADSICLRKLSLCNFDKGLYLSEREENQVLNPKLIIRCTTTNSQFELLFPELKNKKSKDLMPILAGCIFLNNESDFFEKSIKILEKLPKRFQIWYGDQIAFKQAIKENQIDYKKLNLHQYLKIIDENLSEKEILQILKNSNTKMITFKGGSKKWMYKIFNFIEHNLSKFQREMA